MYFLNWSKLNKKALYCWSWIEWYFKSSAEMIILMLFCFRVGSFTFLRWFYCWLWTYSAEQNNAMLTLSISKGTQKEPERTKKKILVGYEKDDLKMQLECVCSLHAMCMLGFSHNPSSANPQIRQTQSNNSSAVTDELLECVWLSCGVGAKRIKKNCKMFLLEFLVHISWSSCSNWSEICSKYHRSQWNCSTRKLRITDLDIIIRDGGRGVGWRLRQNQSCT